MITKVHTIYGQTLADVALRETGSVEAMFDIAELNDRNVSDELNDGVELKIPVFEDITDGQKKVIYFFNAQGFFPASGYRLAEVQTGGAVTVLEVIIPNRDEINVIERQTLADLAVQIFGDVMMMFDLASLNDLSVSDWLEPGMKLKIPANISENDNNRYYKSNNLYPANGWDVTEQAEAETLTGIDYWIIEEDFVVQ